jgi:hypothetical protein
VKTDQPLPSAFVRLRRDKEATSKAFASRRRGKRVTSGKITGAGEREAKIYEILSKFPVLLFLLSCFETPSLPTLRRRYPCGFTFYVAHPMRSIP